MSAPGSHSRRLVIISDTHGHHEDVALPDGDVLLHAGDLTGRGSLEDLRAVHAWLARQPHPHKVVIAGNHDFCLQREPAVARAVLTACEYLEDEEVTVAGVRVYGSPWQPWFFDWAFNLPRGAEIRARWEHIPQGLDVLLTHGPPAGVLDVTSTGDAVGCEDLAEVVARVRPRLHVFGHIHESYGRVLRDGVHFVNASTCDHHYHPTRAPVVVDLPVEAPR